MSAEQTELIRMLEFVGLGAVLVFARVSAMVSVVPGFGELVVPVRVKLAVAVAFTAIVLPAVPNVPAGKLLTATLIVEVLTGLFFGICLRLFVHVLQMAGSIAAQSMALSQIFGGTAGVDPQPAMGRVLLMAGLGLAAMMGIHLKIIDYVMTSYQMVPIGAVTRADIVTDLGVERIAHSFALAFTFAAPFVIGSLIYNLTLGFVNKAMPQLMVSFVGAPAITAGGLLLLMVCSPLLLSLWHDALAGFMGAPFAGAR